MEGEQVSLFDLSAEVLALSGNTVTITRFNAQAFDSNGRLNASTTSSTFSLTASIQPLSGRDVQRLPEGLRDRRGHSIWHTTELRPADAAAGTPGDRFTYDGRTFEVISSERWADLGNFFKSIALQVER